MDTAVGPIAEVITAALEAVGYIRSTVGQHKKAFSELAVLAEDYDGFYSEEIGAEYAEVTSGQLTDCRCENMRRSRRRIIHVFDLFIEPLHVRAEMKRRIHDMAILYES